MEKTYIPHGVCSRSMHVVVENGIIKDLKVVGGCNGNLKGICALVKDQKAEDVIERLKGTRCGMKPTSCPDQIARALQEALDEERGAAL